MKYDFTYNGKVMSYEIIYKDVKNINIRVRPDGQVFVSCNSKVDNKTIEIEMIKRVNWLLETINEYKVKLIEFSNPDLKLVDGEAFLMFGKILRIKNVEADKFKVEYDNNYLYIYRNNKRGIKQKFNEWHRGFVISNFNEMVEDLLRKFEKYGIQKPKVIIKNMKTQWGSCNIDKRTITLNIQLAKVDKFLTEYVVCHELTHLKYRNHNRDFYTFLTAMIPDWKQREKLLNNIFIKQTGGY